MTITKLTREGRKLHAALVGDKIDAGHPEVKLYLQSKGVSTVFRRAKRPEHTELEGFPDDGTPQAMVDVQQLRLCEINARFGGEAEFNDWLKALLMAEELRSRRLKNADFEGSSISRELVRTHLVGLIEETYRRLMTDAPKTIARQLHANARSGLQIEESEADVRDIVGKALSSAKHRAVVSLRLVK